MSAVVSKPSPARVAVIAGATGAVASRLVEHLNGLGWTVVGLCRTPPAASGRVRYVNTDLLDAASVRAALAGVPGITHIFYAARAKFREGGTESVAENVAMLRNLLDAAEPHGATLEHVHLVEGGKWYGQHLGPYPTPSREDDPRHMPPNFYYEQEDLLRDRQKGRNWAWSASRPNAICDFAPDRARNIVSIVGAYAAICRELGLRLDYPGHPLQFRALTEVTDATHLARAITFLATAPSAANTAFNVTNGDVFRWERLWPRIAEFFGLEVGIVRMMSLADMMRDKDDVWAAIVSKRGLEPRRLADIAQWSFADVLLRQTFDVVSSTTKLRRAGFSEIVDTEEMFLAHLARYREARIIG
jgi:nucleoside-diphosphate-sugar epimerase